MIQTDEVRIRVEKQFEYDERQERLLKSFEVMDEYETICKHEAELKEAIRPQRAMPASVAQIEAQNKQARRESSTDE